MKKVLQIIPHLNLGGAEVMCKHLSVALKNAGYDVMVVSFFNDRSRNTADLEAMGIPIVYLGKKNGIDLSLVKKLRKVIRDFAPDVIHTHLAAVKYAFVASMGMKKRIVHTVHSVAQQECGRFARMLNKLFLKSKNVTFVALSEIVADTIHDVYKLPMERIPIVYNGVPLESCLTKTDWTAHDPVSIANVAGFRPVKNHIALLDAVKQLTDKGHHLKLFLYGDGSEREQIEQHISQNQLQNAVVLCGFSETVAENLHNSDIFVLPSLYEGISMAIIEAMGTGLPIVASAVGGIPNMITDGEDGLLCEPTAESIAEKLEKLINDPVLRTSVGQKAVDAAERFSASSMMKGYLAVY